MTPLSFEWAWNVDYFFFMGFLYLALVIIGIGVFIALARTWLGLTREEEPPEAPPEISYRSTYSRY